MTGKVIITGGAGFIGSHTAVELVAAGFTPVIVDNFGASERRVVERLRGLVGKDLRVHELDCRDSAALTRVLEEEGPALGLIHFAAHKAVAVSCERALEYYDNNVGSLLSVLKAMAHAEVPHLVFSSSATVYGAADVLPVTEDSPLKPAASPYGATKQVCELILKDCAASQLPIKSVVLRYFNPVGAHPSAQIGELPIGKPENLVPFITQTAAGWREELTVFGADYPTRDGTCTRDYIHVVDLARAHIAALAWLTRQTSPRLWEVFNIGTGRSTSVLEAISAFERASGEKLRYRMGPRRPGDVVESYANVEKAERALQWRAQFGIEQAMADAWRWQKTLGDKPAR